MKQQGTEARRAVERRMVERRWRERLAAWRRSGHDEQLFCRRQKLGLCAFRWWLKRLGPDDGSNVAERVDLRRAVGKNPSRGAEKWAALSAEWERSGVDQTEFCQQRGLAVHTLRWWRWRLGQGGGARGSPARTTAPTSPEPAAMPAFVPVQVIATPQHRPPSAVSTMDIILRRRRRLRVSSDFDPHFLARVVKVLEAVP